MLPGNDHLAAVKHERGVLMSCLSPAKAWNWVVVCVHERFDGVPGTCLLHPLT